MGSLLPSESACKMTCFFRVPFILAVTDGWRSQQSLALPWNALPWNLPMQHTCYVYFSIFQWSKFSFPNFFSLCDNGYDFSSILEQFLSSLSPRASATYFTFWLQKHSPSGTSSGSVTWVYNKHNVSVAQNSNRSVLLAQLHFPGGSGQGAADRLWFQRQVWLDLPSLIEQLRLKGRVVPWVTFFWGWW